MNQQIDLTKALTQLILENQNQLKNSSSLSYLALFNPKLAALLGLNDSFDSGVSIASDHATATLSSITSPTPNPNIAKFYGVSKWLNVILITIIEILGIYGNIISIVIFFSKLYNKSNSMKSLKVYLITLSFSDLFVLVFHYIDFTFRSWVNLTDTHKNARFNFVDKFTIFCKLIPYLRNVFRSISVYILILMALQRLIILYFPLNRAKWSSPKFNNTLVSVLITLAFLLNTSTMVMNTLLEHKDHDQATYCSVEPSLHHIQFKLEILFTLFTIFIPCCIILALSIILYNKINPNKIKAYQAVYQNNVFKSKMLTTSSPNIVKNVNQIPKNEAMSDVSENRQMKMNRNGVNVSVFGKASSEGPTSSYEMKSLTHYKNDRYGAHKNAEKDQDQREKFIMNGKISVKTPTVPNTIDTCKSKRRRSSILDNYNQSIMNYKKQLANSVRTNYMLVLVSKYFILLHLPYFICWCLVHIHYVHKIEGDLEAPEDQMSQHLLLRSLLNIFEILFVLNYGINFFVYLMNFPLFRKIHAYKLNRFYTCFKPPQEYTASTQSYKSRWYVSSSPTCLWKT